jgi:hypothetical protein
MFVCKTYLFILGDYFPLILDLYCTDKIVFLLVLMLGQNSTRPLRQKRPPLHLSIKKSYIEFQKRPCVLSVWNSVAASMPLPELVNEALYGTVASLRQKRRGRIFSNHRRCRRGLGFWASAAASILLWNSGSIIADACQWSPAAVWNRGLREAKEVWPEIFKSSTPPPSKTALGSELQQLLPFSHIPGDWGLPVFRICQNPHFIGVCTHVYHFLTMCYNTGGQQLQSAFFLEWGYQSRRSPIQVLTVPMFLYSK